MYFDRQRDIKTPPEWDFRDNSLSAVTDSHNLNKQKKIPKHIYSVQIRAARKTSNPESCNLLLPNDPQRRRAVNTLNPPNDP